MSTQTKATENPDQMNVEPNPPTEPPLTIHQALCGKKTKALKEMVDGNHFLIYEVFDTIVDILRQSQESKGVIVYCFFMMEELINDYGIPVVLLLNNPEITETLYAVSQQDFQEEVMRILEKCLSIFSFDKERSIVEQLAELWCKVKGPETPFPDKQLEQTKFNKLFAKAHKVLLAYEKTGGQLSSIRKREFFLEMKEILEREDFHSTTFNPMEKELAQYYQSELQSKVQVLDENPEKHVKRASRVISIEESDDEDGLEEIYPNKDGKSKEESKKGKTEDSMNIEDEEEEKTEKKPKKKVITLAREREEKKPLHVVKASDSPNATTALHLKRSFVLNERVNEDESNVIEFKDFEYPLDQGRNFILQKTICSFLNRRGGRIYIGINDSKYVRGISLTSKERDSLKLDLFELIRHFEPSIFNEELLQVVFLPIQDKYKKEMIPGLFMVKIIVKQGDPSELYSISKLHFQAYLRNDGQSVQLSTREITETIKKRDKVPEHRIPSQEWDDPAPENLVDIEHRRSHYNYDVKNRFDQALKYSNSRKDSNGHGHSNHGNHKERSNHFNNHHSHNNQKTSHVQKEKSPNTHKSSGEWTEQKKAAPGQEIFEVVVSNIPQGYSEEQWQGILKQGKYTSIIRHKRLKGQFGKSEGKAFVGFSNIEEASKFIDHMNNKKIGKFTLHADFNYA